MEKLHKATNEKNPQVPEGQLQIEDKPRGGETPGKEQMNGNFLSDIFYFFPFFPGSPAFRLLII